ncbi:MAG: hypothetical protein K2M46_00345 [Lachnospiraceae bacterium]|nr:hypothetical protein [Lachnospiraceae bacterium]
MKLRNIMVSTLLIGTLALTGCQKAENSDVNDIASDNQTILKVTDEMAEKYVTLGNYKGLELIKYISEVSDSDVEYAKETFMEDYRVDSEVTDRAIETGDYVCVNLTETPEGSDETMDYGDIDIEIGQAEISEAIDEALLGHKTGDTVTVEDTGEDEEGAEIKVTYTLEVASVYTVSYPEYNDEFVKDNTEYTTTAQLDESFVEQVKAENENTSMENLRDLALSKAVENSEFQELPQDLLDSSYQEVEESYETYAAMFGMELSDMISEEELQSIAEMNLKEKLVIQALVKAEGITKEQDKYQDFLKHYMAYMEVESEDEMMEYYSEDELEELYYREKALDAVIAKSMVTEEEAQAEEYEEEEYEEEELNTEDLSLEVGGGEGADVSQ